MVARRQPPPYQTPPHVDGSRGVGLVAPRNGVKQSHVEQSGGHSQRSSPRARHQAESGRREHRQVQQGGACEAARECQQERHPPPRHDPAGRRRRGHHPGGQAEKVVADHRELRRIAVIPPRGKDGPEKRQQKTREKKAGQRPAGSGRRCAPRLRRWMGQNSQVNCSSRIRCFPESSRAALRETVDSGLRNLEAAVRPCFGLSDLPVALGLHHNPRSLV